MALRSWMFAGDPDPVGATRDLTIPGPAGGIPARLSPALSVSSASVPLPLLVYFHGGGWVLGDIDTHDPSCRFLCAGRASRSSMSTTDWRRAPLSGGQSTTRSRPFAGRMHTRRRPGVDAGRIAVRGDSAGATSRRSSPGDQAGRRSDAGPAVPQCAGDAPRGDDAFARTLRPGYFLTKANMDWYRAHYLGAADPSDVTCAPRPLLADDLEDCHRPLRGRRRLDVLRDPGHRVCREAHRCGRSHDPARPHRCRPPDADDAGRSLGAARPRQDQPPP